MNFELKLKWSFHRISCKFFRNRVSLHQGKVRVGMESTNEHPTSNKKVETDSSKHPSFRPRKIMISGD